MRLLTIFTGVVGTVAAWASFGAEHAGGSWLDSSALSAPNREVFTYAMNILDSEFGLPLLWGSAKLSSWYAVGLLARGGHDDVALANKVISNLVTQQFTDPGSVAYGTFKNDISNVYAGELYTPEIYDSYDPNNALFVTIAGIVIDAEFGHLLEPHVAEALREAMRIAVEGDGRRVAGVDDDNLRPAYTNPWVMRVVSSSYVGAMLGDANMTSWGETWGNEFVDLFDTYGTISEFNGGTYAGVTLFALSLSQYLPTNSVLARAAPRIMASIWDTSAELYNPSLTTLGGPWDRTYGADLTQYYGILGSAITGVTGMHGKCAPLNPSISRLTPDPMPRPLGGSAHYTDMAIIPMQMVTAPYAEAELSDDAKDKLESLYAPHGFATQAISPPFDKRPRNYSAWIDHGLCVGGIEFDESEVGGPSINKESFSPGVVLWDAGRTGAGVGWISYYPTNPSVSIVATDSALTIQYPPSVDFPDGNVSTVLQLSISSLPFLQLGRDAFANNAQSLPGLDVALSGNVVENARREFTYTGDQLNGFYYYNLTYAWDEAWGKDNVPELVVRFTKTTPPSYDGWVTE